MIPEHRKIFQNDRRISIVPSAPYRRRKIMNRAKKSKKQAIAVASAGPPFCTRLKKNCRNTMFRTRLIINDIEATMTGVLVSRVE